MRIGERGNVLDTAGAVVAEDMRRYSRALANLKERRRRAASLTGEQRRIELRLIELESADITESVDRLRRLAARGGL